MTDMHPQYFPMVVKIEQVISTRCIDYAKSAKLTGQNLLLKNISNNNCSYEVSTFSLIGHACSIKIGRKTWSLVELMKGNVGHSIIRVFSSANFKH